MPTFIKPLLNLSAGIVDIRSGPLGIIVDFERAILDTAVRIYDSITASLDRHTFLGDEVVKRLHISVRADIGLYYVIVAPRRRRRICPGNKEVSAITMGDGLERPTSSVNFFK
jgi:hypothetical protein